MIQAIVFDVGGVLIRTEDQTPRRQLERRLGLQPGEAEQIVFNSEMGRSAQAGQVSAYALWAWVADRLHLDPGALEQFRREFWAGDRLDAGMVDYIRSLKPRYQTAIISNAMDDLGTLVSTAYPIDDAFDVIVGSADVGIMKPDPAIYALTLARLKRAPAEAVFVDDFPHNVEGALAVGMQAIHYTPGLDVPAALAAYGVTP